MKIRAWIICCVRAVPQEEVNGLRGEYETRLAAYVEEIEAEKARRRLAERERDEARAALKALQETIREASCAEGKG